MVRSFCDEMHLLRTGLRVGIAVTSPEFRATLKSLGLSQRSLAERCGLDVTTVNRWATGRAPVPKYAAYILSLLAERDVMLLAPQRRRM